MIPRNIVPILAFTLTLTVSPTGAQNRPPPPQPTPGATATDLLLARPGGLAATALGSVIFVIGLPFTLINGSTNQSAQTLMGRPAQYTFSRPLGENIGGMGDPGN
ncbi:MAG: hypothetical protein LAE24_06790 [Candidatus Contendobacter sp.]|jgi:hypothetical protein|nr:hypothetical protein [Candidatus Contendobacter sp.]